MLDLDEKQVALTAPLPLTRHPAAVYLRSLGSGSRPTMEQSLNEIAALLTNGNGDAMTLNWAALEYHHVSALQAALLERYAPATAKKMMCALRRVFQEARKLGFICGDTYQNLIDLQPIRESNKLRGRALSLTEISALIKACTDDPTLQGVRDAALIAILRGTGLRRAEVVKLDLKDYQPRTLGLTVRSGKGGKDRTVYLPQGAVGYLKSWLKARGSVSSALLCPIKKGGEIEYRAMTPQAVLLIVRKRAMEAGISSFSPHDFRRTFCSDLLDAGVDIVTVQKLAGHSSPVTTARYDRRGEETKRKAVQKLEF
jgi:integrase/recombinase XerD